MHRNGAATPVDDTREVNPGEVWEENEFWIELSWRIDPDGKLGIKCFVESEIDAAASDSRVDEYYRYIFDNSVPGLPEKAESRGPRSRSSTCAATAPSRSPTTSTRPTNNPSPTKSSTTSTPTSTAASTQERPSPAQAQRCADRCPR